MFRKFDTVNRTTSRRKYTMENDNHTYIKRNFGPVYDANSRILILGSFPSVKSREAAFFYGHPQNRFWKIMGALLKCEIRQILQRFIVMGIRHTVFL